MLRSIIGYYLPSKGTINLSGYDLQNIPSKSSKSHYYCPQKFNYLLVLYMKIYALVLMKLVRMR